MLRGTLSWASLLAIPAGIVIGLLGSMTVGALMVFGGTLAYFLVDPIMLILDMKPGGDSHGGKGGLRRRGR
jgi:hypothetical protein